MMLKRLWRWFDDRTGIWKLLEPMLFHPVPPETVSGKGTWMYIFGTATLIAFLLQVATGTALMLRYVPSPANAYDSLQYITDNVWLGSTLRAMPYFGASAMVVLISIHSLRVFLTGSYKFPREFNWLTGVILLGLTLAMAFTGQLLRWMVVVLLALIFGPKPLGDPPDPSLVTVNPQPDWLFRWYYALLTLKPESLENFVMVYGPILLGLVLILLPFVFNQGRRTLIHRPWAVGSAGFVVVSLIVLTMIGMRPYWVPDFGTEPLSPELLPVTDEEVLDGSQLFYLKGCQYCHRVLDRGGEYGPDLTDVRKPLAPEIMAVRIVTGVGEMPAYRDILTTGELNAIVAFLIALGEPSSQTNPNSACDLRARWLLDSFAFCSQAVLQE